MTMKNTIVVSLLIILCYNALAQKDAEQVLSNVEKFTQKPDVLIEKQFVELGNVDEIDVRAYLVKDLFSGETKSGIRFEYQFSNEILSQTKIAYIDNDEVDALIKALQTITSTVLVSKRTSNVEVTFTSRTTFIVGCNYSTVKEKWLIFIQLNRGDSHSTVITDTDELNHFITLLKLSKGKI
jgi:hypothetical protein